MRYHQMFHACLAVLLASLAATASAAPTQLDSRSSWTGLSSREFTEEGCRPIIFIYARETIAPGNMGFWVGPEISNRLKLYFGVDNVATEGVDYLGRMDTNLYPGGAPPFGIYLMQVLLTRAVKECPSSKVIAAGYSQGAAVLHRAVQYLDEEIRDRITAVVTFGDTQTLQDGGRIIGYPLDQTLIICNVGDVICTGTLYVFPIHLDYTKRVPEAVHWLIWKILSSYFNPPITPWYWWEHPPAWWKPPSEGNEGSGDGDGEEEGECDGEDSGEDNNEEEPNSGGEDENEEDDPNWGTMLPPFMSMFPSIPVGDPAPTVTVGIGTAPPDPDLGDVLSDYPELSTILSSHIPGFETIIPEDPAPSPSSSSSPDVGLPTTVTVTATVTVFRPPDPGCALPSEPTAGISPSLPD